MLSKQQYALLLDTFKSAQNAKNSDAFLSDIVDLLYNELKPISVSVYTLVGDERLVLHHEAGKNFDELVVNIYNFSLIVRKAIKKKSVLFLPTSKPFQNDEINISVAIIPLLHSDIVVGMICLVFPLEELQHIQNSTPFFTLIGKIAGTIRYYQTGLKVAKADTAEEEFEQKITSLRVLAQGVAHEFNNILAVIKGYAELLLMNEAVDESVKEAVAIIDKQTIRGSSLIDRLSVFVTGKEISFEYCSINDLIKEIVDVQRFTLEKESIECKLKLGKVPEVFVDPRQIKEVLLNLIAHARSAIKPNKKGTVTIETSFNRDAVMLKFVNDGVPGCWENGDPDKIKATNGVDSVGNGISLAIAFGIMKSHGGDMTLCHDPAKCNEVTIYFKKFNPSFADAEKKEEKEMLYLGEVRILIVDDEEPIRQFLSSAFERMGYQVLTTDNGQEAIDICTFENIDIVFLDYLMPGYKGDAVFKSIHDVSPATDVVFITGVDSIPDIDKLLMMGLEGVLRKPFKIDTIIKLTNEIMARRYNTLQE